MASVWSILLRSASGTRHGVRARVVERELHARHQARATAVQPATLEIMQQGGSWTRCFSRRSRGVLAGLRREPDVRGRAGLRWGRLPGTVSTVEAAWVIGAGGAYSITRESMSEELAGSTYPGWGLAADVRVSCGLPRHGSALLASPHGYVYLAPLPGAHLNSLLVPPPRKRYVPGQPRCPRNDA